MEGVSEGERGDVAIGEPVGDGDAVEVRVGVGVGVSVGEGEPVIIAARIRILWLLQSATMTFPELLSTATPAGA